jgi:Arc/MetJ-type ribon-helix-helix transcriptional regulator
MIQAKFNLEESHVRFLEQCATYGFKDQSETVRRALDKLRQELEEEHDLRESATLYAETYEEDTELKALTESAMADWPA